MSLKLYVVTPHLKCLDVPVQMRVTTCFYGELTKIIPNYHQILPLILSSESGQDHCCSPARNTVIILNIGTDRSEQTVQTQIRLLLMEQSDQGLLCLLFCLNLLNTILHCKIQLFQL